MNPYLQSGLREQVDDVNASHHRGLILGKGMVVKVHPTLWRVDIQTEEGGILHYAIVAGPHLPPEHKDAAHPSHVVYAHLREHTEDVVCWPMLFRRLQGPQDRPAQRPGTDNSLPTSTDSGNEDTSEDVESRLETGEDGDMNGDTSTDTRTDTTQEKPPERHFYHPHLHIERAGEITVRITTDSRWVVESEDEDYIVLKTDTREIRVVAPTVLIGTPDESRVEYQRDEYIRVTAPEVYVQAETIRLGTDDARERVLLGDGWMAFFNAFVSLFNSHTHTGVQPGSGVSGPPPMPTPRMTDSLLSDCTYTTKDGEEA